MDDSQSMNCLQCVRKHLANSLSYAKEVIAGHGMGASPDHRPDLLGELGNAEHHLETMPEFADVLDKVLQLRRRLEGQGYVPNAGMLEELRNLWLSLDQRVPPLDGFPETLSMPMRPHIPSEP